MVTAAAESPPPMIVVASVSARALAWKKGAGAVHIQTFRLKAVRSFFSKSFTLRLSCSCYCPQTSQQHASQNIAAEQ